MEASGQLHTSAPLPTPGKTPGTHWIRGSVGLPQSRSGRSKRKGKGKVVPVL